VSEAVTFAVPHITLGEDVAAAVVLRDKASVNDGEIQNFAAMRLAQFKVPHQVLIVNEIPRTFTGKVQRIGLAEKLGLAGPNKATCENEAALIAPRTPVEEKLARIWAKFLGLAAVGVADNFFELGGHSLTAAQVISQIENVFGKRLPLRVLFQAPTIDQLARILRQEKPATPWSSLVPVQPNGSRLPFFWVHGESSNAFLPRFLGPDQPFYGLVHQSQNGKPARFTEVETVAAHYLEEMRTVQPEGPYFLGGFSFGGTVAFEMAQQLRKKREEVALLFLLDSEFPGDDIPNSPKVLTKIPLRDKVHRHMRNVAVLGAQEKLVYILVRVRGKITERTARIGAILKKGVSKVCLAMGCPLPLLVRSYYILDIYGKAHRNYVPQLYAGSAIYIKSIPQ